MIAEALKHMLAAGMDHEAIVAAVAEMEAAGKPAKSSAAARQQRYRDRKKAEESITRDVTCVTSITKHNDVTPPPLPLALSPQTPLTHTPTPPDISTRAREAVPKPNGFARFWEAYPNKTGKGAAEKAFARAVVMVGGHDPPGQLVAAVERAKTGRQWSEGYIPNPATWLNQRRWEDEIEAPRVLRVVQDAERPDPRRLAREANLARAFAGAEAASRMRTER